LLVAVFHPRLDTHSRSTILGPCLNWYLINLGFMVPCRQVTFGTRDSRFLVSMLRIPPCFPGKLGVKLLN
jgi:hypothetical protein